MMNITVVTLSDGTIVNTFPGPVDGKLVARAFTELYEQAEQLRSNKSPAPIDSAKVEDTGEPVAITAEMVEAAYGPFLSVTADMVRRASLVEVFRLYSHKDER